MVNDDKIKKVNMLRRKGMSKTEAVHEEMVKAMKAKATERKETLALLLSALKLAAKEKRSPLTEEEENSIILKEIKQTKETIESTPQSRTDIHEECAHRMNVLLEFAPRQMSEEEIQETVKKVLADLSLEAPTLADKGKIMKCLMPLVKGKADGGLVNSVVGQMCK